MKNARFLLLNERKYLLTQKKKNNSPQEKTEYMFFVRKKQKYICRYPGNPKMISSSDLCYIFYVKRHIRFSERTNAF